MENNGPFPPDRPTMLFVDDRTKRIHYAVEQLNKVYDVTIAANVPEALRQLSSEKFEFVSMDHDLGGMDFVELGSENSAMRILEYIDKCGALNHDVKKPVFFIHSSNALAGNAMMDFLRTRNVRCWIKKIDYKPIEVIHDW